MNALPTSAVLEEPISVLPPASQLEEVTLKYRVQPGSPAESRLVEEYLPLVKHVAGRMSMSLPSHIDVQEIYSSGLVGLLQAVRQFDPQGGSTFESYARVRIRGAILDEMRKMDWVPRSIHEKARKVQFVMERLEQMNGRAPTPSEVASALDLTPAEYEQLMIQIKPATFICLDACITSEENGETLRHEMIGDDDQETPDISADRKELSRIIAERLEKLPPMQRKVLALYYFEDMRLREIAEAVGLTESRICQIHSQAILAIKNYVQQKTKVSPV